MTLQWRTTAAEQQLITLDKHTIKPGCSNGAAASVGFRWSKKRSMLKLAVIPDFLFSLFSPALSLILCVSIITTKCPVLRFSGRKSTSRLFCLSLRSHPFLSLSASPSRPPSYFKLLMAPSGSHECREMCQSCRSSQDRTERGQHRPPRAL